MNFSTLHIEKVNKVWTLTLNRPEFLNALNSLVLQELDQALELVLQGFSGECRALILTGAGQKAFVAGADIKEMQGMSPEKAQAFSELGQKVFSKIEALPLPVLAAVNGFALGGGLELAMACDFIWASENARMGLPEVGLGVIPGFGGTVRLARIVGLNRAREMTLTGELIKADEALAVGLVNKVLPQSELLPAAQKLLEGILSKGPLAVEAAKKVILKAYDQEKDQGLLTEAVQFGQMFSTEDLTEGFSAFVEKRKSQFIGK